MGQVNISLEDRVVAALDRIAASKGMRRPELLKAAIGELIDAHEAGRLAFQSTAGPKLDATVSGLIHQLRELVTELDRAQSDNAKLIGRLITRWNGGEEANQMAFERLSSQRLKLNRASYRPFAAKAEELFSRIENTPASVRAELEPQLTSIAELLALNNKLAGTPRTQFVVALGRHRLATFGVLAAIGAVLVVFGGVLTLAASTAFDGLGVASAGKMIRTPPQMCRLINSAYGVDDCTVPANERDLGLRVIAHEDRR